MTTQTPKGCVYVINFNSGGPLHSKIVEYFTEPFNRLTAIDANWRHVRTLR